MRATVTGQPGESGEPADEREDTDVARHLLDVAHALVRAARRSAGPGVRGEVTGAQMDLLRAVRVHPGSTIAEAADRLRLARNTTSTLVTQLVAAGLITRTPDPRDGRIARLHLRPEAASRMAQWHHRRLLAVRGALAVLDEHERVALEAAMEPIARVAAAASPAGDGATGGARRDGGDNGDGGGP